MKKLLPLLILIPVFVLNAFAQKPNEWKGLILDESTPENAVEVLGTPKTDKVDNVKIPAVGDLLTKELKQKKWRVLTFKKLEKIDTAILVFNAQSKLVLIHFETDDLRPQVFVNAYNLPFKPIFSGFAQAISPKDFSRDGNGNVYAKSYPVTYYLYAAAEKSFVVGMVGNAPSFGSALKKSVGVPDSTLAYPGKIMAVELISRSLEDKSGIESLK